MFFTEVIEQNLTQRDKRPSIVWQILKKKLVSETTLTPKDIHSTNVH